MVYLTLRFSFICDVAFANCTRNHLTLSKRTPESCKAHNAREGSNYFINLNAENKTEGSGHLSSNDHAVWSEYLFFLKIEIVSLRFKMHSVHHVALDLKWFISWVIPSHNNVSFRNMKNSFFTTSNWSLFRHLPFQWEKSCKNFLSLERYFSLKLSHWVTVMNFNSFIHPWPICD